MNLAPIVLFVYNRPYHTKQTVEALQKNELAIDSNLFIYCDGTKHDTDKPKVDEVRKYLKSIDGFKTINIIDRERNYGLADNIIGGVTDIVNKYGSVIVLEDDIVTSPYFLRYMNDALSFYRNIKDVWHISGWNYPMDGSGFNKTFFWRGVNCWGWGTWVDRWQDYEKNAQELIKVFSDDEISRFNLDGTYDFWSQVLENDKGKINTWAIFWYATIFINRGLCANPLISYSKNIGFDDSGVHCCETDYFDVGMSDCCDIQFTKIVEESFEHIMQIKYFYLIFSSKYKDNIYKKNLKKIYKNILDLDVNNKYIIYGAGGGANVILGLLPNLICFLVDDDLNKIGDMLRGREIKKVESVAEFKEYMLVISIFEKDVEIKNNLVSNYCFPAKNIILLGQ